MTRHPQSTSSNDLRPTKSWTLASVLTSMLSASVLAGCGYLHKAHREVPHSVITSKTPPYQLAFVETNDEGWFHQPEQAEQALQLVTDSAASGVSTFVVVFVHGWHHNAASDNARCFEATLKRLAIELDGGLFKQARVQTGAGADFRLIGIYVGWRGRSLPGPLDYLTFWGRKGAAERVAEVDLREFLLRLNDRYRAHWQDTRNSHYFGLVTIGHSFGAQIAFRAYAPALEESIRARAPRGSYTVREQTAEALAPAVALPRIEGVGDLTVLVNPAVEAAAFDALHHLEKQGTYGPLQTPILMIVRADEDFPRERLFPLGRRVHRLATFSAPLEQRQRTLEVTALGEYRGHWTHELVAREPLPDLTAQAELPANCREMQGPVHKWPADNPDVSRYKDKEFAAYDWSGTVSLAGAELKPIDGSQEIAQRPFIVAAAGPGVLEGHSGIFTDRFVSFLSRYVGYVQGKRMMQRGVALGLVREATGE